MNRHIASRLPDTNSVLEMHFLGFFIHFLSWKNFSSSESMFLGFSPISTIWVFCWFCYQYDARPCKLPGCVMCLSTRFQTVWGEFRMYFKNFSPNPTEPEDRCYWISGNFTILNDFLIWKFSLGGVFILGFGSPYRNSTLFRHVLAHLQSFIEIPKLGFAPHVFKDHSISRKIRI